MVLRIIAGIILLIGGFLTLTGTWLERAYTPINPPPLVLDTTEVLGTLLITVIEGIVIVIGMVLLRSGLKARSSSS